METQENQNQKTKGILSFIHLIAGSSVVAKAIIVGAALAAGYGSVIYYKGHNVIEQVAAEVIEEESGVHINFVDADKPS